MPSGLLRVFRELSALALLMVSAGVCSAAAQSQALSMTKVDPPDWWAGLPKPMLLVHGTGLCGAAFSLAGDTSIHVRKAYASANGHWAILWLSASPARPETVQLQAVLGSKHVERSYIFHEQLKAGDGFAGFSDKDVMYLIMPDRFADGDLANDHVAGFREADNRALPRAYHGGDLRGIEDHLDYLQNLGVTAIWTTPLYDNSAAQSGQSYHGYSATDMYAIDPHFGTMADYRALVVAAHRHGIKMVLDTVPNHVGPAHPWADDPPMPDWLHGTVAHHIRVDDDFQSVVDPHASAARRHVLLDGWFADVLPDLNQDNPYVAQYLIQNAVWWMESVGLDGLRLDTFPYVPRSFWHQYDAELHELFPQMRDVGEIFNKDPHVTSFFAGGRANTGSDGTVDTGLDTPFDYPMFFALRGALTHHEPMSAIANVLAQDDLYPHPERLVTFLGNHDNARFLSIPGADAKALHLGYGLLATLRGMPQLYYGDEIEMRGDNDPDNRKDYPGGFPGDAHDAFTASGRTAAQQQMFQWVSALMQLRKHAPALQSGDSQTLFADASALAFVRGPKASETCVAAPEAARYVVVANDAVAPRDVRVPLGNSAADGCMHAVSALKDVQGGVSATIDSDILTAHLPGQEIGIFRMQP